MVEVVSVAVVVVARVSGSCGRRRAVTGVVVAVTVDWFSVSFARARSARAALTGEAVGQTSTAATTPTTHTAPPRKRTCSGPRRKRYGRSIRT